MTAFEIVDDERPKRAARKLSEATSEQSAEDSNLAKHFASLFVNTVSARAVAIFSAIFTVTGLGLVWWAWMSILAAPSDRQIIGASLLSLFFLALEWVRRR